MNDPQDNLPGKNNRTANSTAAGGGAAYVLGMIGALVHYWQQADSGWEHLLAALKTLVWPAFVVYDVLNYIN